MSKSVYDSNSRYIQYAYKRNKRELFRLMYVCKFYGIDYKKVPKCIGLWVEKGFTDGHIIELLKRMINKNKVLTGERDRGQKRVFDIFELLTCLTKVHGKDTVPKFTKYLDIGAGNCEITSAIAMSLSVEEKHVYALDVESWSNKENKSDTVNYVYVEHPETEDALFEHGLETESFDIITIFQTLHHMKNAINVIKEVYGLLKPGGIVILREHDVESSTTAALCHVEHLIYSIFADEMQLTDFFKEYYGRYFSKHILVKEFESVGFHTLNGKAKNNPTHYYYQVYKK
jgi:2-polyprenyl-3-methyl-5-hydroxy-6-metoxy-1,4-benzoquinol methylase